MRILEVGTGSGYQAAVLAAIGCEVLSIERHAELAEQARRTLADDRLEAACPGLAGRIRIEVGDGSLGRPAESPFDGIVVTAAAPRIPEPLRDQLADGGRLVIPVGPMRAQVLTLVIRSGGGYDTQPNGGCVFVPLIGAGGYGEDVLANRDRPRHWP
jgi:protein-L-isoaspartate(D-aspartate) O-methyltransferase